MISIQSSKNKPEQKLVILSLIKKHFEKDLYIKNYNFGDRVALVLSNSKSKNIDFIISTHSDVVEAQPEQFKVLEKNGKLFGRGVFDMKGAMLASIQALVLNSTEKNIPKVAIFVTTDEEMDGLSTKHLLEKSKYKARFAIIPDGGGDKKLSIEQKGFLQLKVEIAGKSTHASEPWNGINPVELSLDFLKSLKKLYPNPKSSNIWKTTATATKIEGGISLNQIPSKVALFLDIRFVDGESVKRIMHEIGKILPKNAIINVVAQNEPFLTNKENMYLGLLAESIKQVCGVAPTFTRDCSTSDAIFFQENNIPAVLLRPLGGNPHTESEWVSKKSLEQFTDILSHFIKNFS